MRCSPPGSQTLHSISRHLNYRFKQKYGSFRRSGSHHVQNCLHVRVAHPHYIRVVGKHALWRLFKEATPQHAWEDAAVSLACLESLYRIEFSQASEECIAALNAANSAPVPADDEAKSAQQQRQQQQHDEQADDEVVAAASAAVKVVTTAVAAATTNAGETPPEQQQPSEEQLMQAVAEQADKDLAAHIKYLANRSHFQFFTRRDCELGKTLNQGYQGQLFIQSNDRKLDKSLWRAFTASMGPSSNEAAQQDGVPERGSGQQKAQGSLDWDYAGQQGSVNGHELDQQTAEGSLGLKSAGQQGSMHGRELDQQVQDSPNLNSTGVQQDCLHGQEVDQQMLPDSFGVDSACSQQSGTHRSKSDQQKVQDDDSEEPVNAQQRSVTGPDPYQQAAQNNSSLDVVHAHQGSMPVQESEQGMQKDNHSRNPRKAQQASMPGDGTGQGSNIPGHRLKQQALLEESRSSRSPGAHLSSKQGCGTDQGWDVPRAHLSSAPGCGPDQWVMQETGVVVMKRGFSRETATGRLLLPKLDYLQTAVVEEALLRIRSLLRAWWQGLLHMGQRSLADASNTLAKENTEQEMGPTSILERVTRAGERAIAWLSVRGAAPIVDSMTIQDIDRVFPVVEPQRLSPLLLKVVGLKEILGAKSIFQQAPNDIVQLLIQPLELEEPTLQEIAVLYRRVQRPERTGFWGKLKGFASAIWQKGTRSSPPSPRTTVLRPPISLQIYRDIPLPTWSVVLPEKVLQFRPLDFLRTDLFAAAGLVAALAQARYESFYLDVVTAVSASIFLIRIFLGFRRQVDRYRVRLAEILREKTVACDATAIQYIAASAADQQFVQAALCYVLLLQHQDDAAQGSETIQGHTGIGLEALAIRAEQLLAEHAGLHVCLNVDQAMDELLQRGLAYTCPSDESLPNDELSGLDGEGHARKDAQHHCHMMDGQFGCEERGAQRSSQGMEGGSHHQWRGEEQCFRAVDPHVAQQVLEQQWDSILWQRVHSTLGRVEAF